MPKIKILNVHIVLSKEEHLVFPVQDIILGQTLFDSVCRTIGLREPWYFGLQYKSVDGQSWWLDLHKKIKKQLSHVKGEPELHLRVQFYPEDVEDGLVQELTQHLFFVQVKEAILNMDVYCPAEEAILMASHAVQAKYGDYDDNIHKKGFLINEQLLPKRVTSLYQLNDEQWEERIVAWYAEHCAGLSKSEAEIEYLKIAQDLEMYGISYFPIKNDNHTDLWLGIDAMGVNIYEEKNKLLPKVSFYWSETKNISFKNKVFVIEPMVRDKDLKTFEFISLDVNINRQILQLCVGNHDLYMKRRRPDSLELHVLKSQAKEERERRQYEQQRYWKERKLRMEAVSAKIEMEKRLQEYQMDLEKYRQQLDKAEETTDLLAEKALIAEEESRLLLQKAAELETEIQRLHVTCTKREEEKNYLESRIQTTDVTIKQLLHESQMRAQESMILKQQLDSARQSEKLAKEKLIQISVTSQKQFVPYMNGSNQGGGVNMIDVDGDSSVELLSKEIQKERVQYLEKSHHLQKQLTELKTEIEGLKVTGTHDLLDSLHKENVAKGENKYSTMQKMQAGSTNSRLQVFQQL